MRSHVSIFLLLLTVTPVLAASDGCDPVPQMIVSTSATTDPELAAKQASLLQGYMSADLINALKDVAAELTFGHRLNQILGKTMA